MKTINAILGVSIFSSLMLSPLLGSAQHTETTERKATFRVRIDTNDNGKRTGIDTMFKTEAGMKEFLNEMNRNENRDLSLPQPPAPPSLPARPRPPLPPSPPVPPKPPVTSAKPDSQFRADFTFIEQSDKSSTTRKKLVGDNDQGEKDLLSSSNVLLPEEQFDNVTDVSVSPNPNRGRFDIRFKVDLPDDVQVKLNDINGKEIYSETLKGYSGSFFKAIDCNKDAAGNYMFEITAQGFKKVLRVMVQ